MSKLKLFCIVSKHWRKYNSFRGSQDSIKPSLIKHNFSAIRSEHMWCSDVTVFKFIGHKTNLIHNY